MPIKYHCPKCGKRYVEWGAKKLGFHCPACAGSELVRSGGGPDRAAANPALRRRVRVPVDDEEEAPLVPLDEPEDAEEFPVGGQPFVALSGDGVDVAPDVDLTGGVLVTPDEIDFDGGAGVADADSTGVDSRIE